jgi:uncharacterized protein YndB with AHSA1/START domain
VSATSRVPVKRVMTMTRVFDAPRELVWRVYTEPEHIVHWLSAKEWTTPSAAIDLRRGGTFNVEMRPFDPKAGEGFFMGGTYDEIKEPELIVQLLGDGRIMRTTFEDAGAGKTKLTLSWEMAMDEALERQGYTEILEKLTGYLRDRRTGEPEVILTRLFDAPRDIVFDAFTNPEHLRHWFGPNGFTVPTAESDARPGGKFAVCMNFTDGDGKDYWARGEYKEVVPPQRLVMTMSGEGSDGNIEDTHVTITFTERGGKTLVIIHQTGMPIAQIAGASQGWTQSLDKLAAYLTRR